jgi:tetratricopeptide (TPR) repeat protein
MINNLLTGKLAVDMRVTLIAVLVILSPCSYAQKQRDLSSLTFTPELIPSSRNPESLTKMYSGSNPIPSPLDIGDTNYFSPADLFYERNNSIADYSESIVVEESESGPYSTELIEELIAVGILNQHQGRHEEALENFQRAMHITRVNYGLYSLEQIPVLERIIESQLATGDRGEADFMREYIFRLRWNSYNKNDIRMLPLLSEFANWQIRSFEEITSNPAPVVKIRFNSFTGRSFDPDTPRFQALMKLYRARFNYIQAIQLILNNGEFTHPDLPELERNLARTFYLQYREGYYQKIVTGSHIHKMPVSIYRYGKNAYERMLIYEQNDPERSMEDIIKTLMEMGDWSLVFRFRHDARKYYQEAYQLLTNHQVADECIEKILSPEIPVNLPNFSTDPVCPHTEETEGEQAGQHLGYIDVSFKINKFGQTRELMILDKSPNTTADIERRLRSHIDDSIFRPRFTAGRITVSGTVLRYYYDL